MRIEIFPKQDCMSVHGNDAMFTVRPRFEPLLLVKIKYLEIYMPSRPKLLLSHAVIP